MALPLVRDLMQIGVPNCRIDEPLPVIARRMVEQTFDALVVLDENGNACGWLDVTHMAGVLHRNYEELTVGDVMEQDIPEMVADVSIVAAAQVMLDRNVRQLFIMHHLGTVAASAVITLRDVLLAMASMERTQGVGGAVPRPDAVDAFRQRHGLPSKDES